MRPVAMAASLRVLAINHQNLSLIKMSPLGIVIRIG
jgi:hypothetical protein